MAIPGFLCRPSAWFAQGALGHRRGCMTFGGRTLLDVARSSGVRLAYPFGSCDRWRCKARSSCSFRGVLSSSFGCAIAFLLLRNSADRTKELLVSQEVDCQFLSRLVFRPPRRHARISAYSASAFRCFDCWSGGGVGRCCHFASVAGGSVVGSVLVTFRWSFLGSLRLALVIGSRPHRVAAYFCILLDPWPRS